MEEVKSLKKLEERFEGLVEEMEYVNNIYQNLQDKFLGTKKIPGTYDYRTKDAIHEVINYQKCINFLQGETGTEIYNKSLEVIENQEFLYNKNYLDN